MAAAIGHTSSKWMRYSKNDLAFQGYLVKARQNMKEIQTVTTKMEAGYCYQKITPRLKLLNNRVTWRFFCPTDTKY